MNFWLIKSEPFVYSYDQLLADGRTAWEGVRNYQARNYLRSMRIGDLALYYHSNEGLEVVGIAQVVREHYPDSTAQHGDWSVVDFAPVRKLGVPVTLSQIKATAALAGIALVRNGRLSVMPLSEMEFQTILALGQTSI
jgi:predicted RNA-binding protein with PUA-like domain